jgi:endonuclease YncB( thermonuclease family)
MDHKILVRPARKVLQMRRRSISLFVGFGLLLLLSQLALAYQLVGKVVGVTDGDTLTVSDNSNSQHVIRLAGIDAPEHGQAFGAASEKHLADLVLDKNVNLDCTNEQSYGRLVCKVLLHSGEDVDLDQVKAGMAWHYKQYAYSQTLEDRQTYALAEDAAREAHLGLWSDAHPVQPQDFRHGSQSPLCVDNLNHRIACSQQYAGPVRGNARSHIYHWAGCPNYDEISQDNRVSFANAQAAEAAGYRAARNFP